MKQILITLTMLLVLGMTTEAVAQKHRHTPQPQQAELVDSTSKSGVEAFSDTTSIDTGAVTKHRSTVTVTTQTSPWSSKTTTYEVDDDDFSGMTDHIFRHFGKGIAGMFFVPEQLLKDQPGTIDDEYQKGLRQCFVGIGLMIFLGYAAGTVGFGVGALVFFIGLGKIVASKMASKNNPHNEL